MNQFRTSVAWEYLKVEILALQIVSQNVQHPDHLGEDEDSVASLLQTNQQFVQKHQLPAAADQLLKEENRLQPPAVTRRFYSHRPIRTCGSSD